MSENVVIAEELTKQFDNLTAVDHLSFTVRKGVTTALLGGNGAGKTTTLAMLLGLLLPTSGSIRIFGCDMLADRFPLLARMNFSSPYVDLPHRLTVRQNLMVYAHLYRLADTQGRIAQLAKDLDLAEILDRPYGKLSAGQKTRVALAKSLLNAPELLLLDEPTASLDPDTADYVRGYLQAYQRNSGASILLASHNMLEVERLCADVIMLKRGTIVDRGAPEELIARYGLSNLEQVFIDIARQPHGAAT